MRSGRYVATLHGHKVTYCTVTDVQTLLHIPRVVCIVYSLTTTLSSLDHGTGPA